MRKQNNKLEPYVQNKGIIRRLEILQQKTPSIFNMIQGMIIGVGKPVMAVRAGLYRATGGVFANSNIPWFKVLLIVAGAYVLTYKNLNLNFNLNAPQMSIPDASSMSVAQSFSSTAAFVFDDDTNLAYINRFKDIALAENKKFGIPVSVKLGQAILESNAGQSTNAMSLHNHFNLRCGELSVGFCTETPNGMFNEFMSTWEGWRMHSEFITTGSYAELKHKAGNDYKKWAKGLKQLGYNSDRQYAEKLVQIIEHYNLQKFD
ncbi:MAG: hypothetical protein ACI97N_002329 [Cognaticolwellia sp.]|jgi:hypothetical protein